VNIGIIFKEIGKYSFGIYLIHVMFLTIYERLLSIYNITYDKGGASIVLWTAFS